MKVKYSDLIDQTFDFPQSEFDVDKRGLHWHGIPQMQIIKRYGSPLKITYLPKITDNINRAKNWFNQAMAEHGYQGNYNYAYVTKSSHYMHVIKEALKNNVVLETSSAYDMSIMEQIYKKNLITTNQVILCNGFKTDKYLDKIASLINLGFKNIISIVDHIEEIDQLKLRTRKKLKIGIRIAAEEEPKFEFYTSRLGIGYKNIVPFYKKHVQQDKQVRLTMLHFFINTGINDNAYYWNELHKCLSVFTDLAKVCTTLTSLNIGGGFPIKNSLSFEYNYEYMASEIVHQIKLACDAANVNHPDLYTEFGSFTVGESGAVIFKVLYQKKQNDREYWNMIDGSFMTTLPDTWAISKRFIMLPVNRWDCNYERVFLGGITCDSDDYYNSEQHTNAIYLPKFDRENPLYIGFYNTGAYQDSLGGVGGIHHCLIPNPKHVLIDRDTNGKLTYKMFAPEQSDKSILKILGYS